MLQRTRSVVALVLIIAGIADAGWPAKGTSLCFMQNHGPLGLRASLFRNKNQKKVSVNAGGEEVGSATLIPETEALTMSNGKKEKRLRDFLQNILRNVDVAKTSKGSTRHGFGRSSPPKGLSLRSIILVVVNMYISGSLLVATNSGKVGKLEGILDNVHKTIEDARSASGSIAATSEEDLRRKIQKLESDWLTAVDSWHWEAEEQKRMGEHLLATHKDKVSQLEKQWADAAAALYREANELQLGKSEYDDLFDDVRSWPQHNLREEHLPKPLNGKHKGAHAPSEPANGFHVKEAEAELVARIERDELAKKVAQAQRARQLEEQKRATADILRRAAELSAQRAKGRAAADALRMPMLRKEDIAAKEEEEEKARVKADALKREEEARAVLEKVKEMEAKAREEEVKKVLNKVHDLQKLEEDEQIRDVLKKVIAMELVAEIRADRLRRWEQEEEARMREEAERLRYEREHEEREARAKEVLDRMHQMQMNQAKTLNHQSAHDDTSEILLRVQQMEQARAAQNLYGGTP